MDDMAAFLAARYDEAEATAKAAYQPGPSAQQPKAPPQGSWWTTAQLMERLGPGTYNDATYIADVDPAHRLADIKLKRAILAEHPHCRVDYSMTLRTDLDEPFGCSTCDWDRDYGQGGEGWCATVRQLGTEFSDHPDYKPGWRPDDTAAAAP